MESTTPIPDAGDRTGGAGDEQRKARPAATEETPREVASGSPKLRAQVDIILSQPVGERLRQIEAEAAFFDLLRPLD